MSSDPHARLTLLIDLADYRRPTTVSGRLALADRIHRCGMLAHTLQLISDTTLRQVLSYQRDLRRDS